MRKLFAIALAATALPVAAHAVEPTVNTAALPSTTRASSARRPG